MKTFIHHDNTPMRWAVISGNPIIEAIGRLTEKRIDKGGEALALAGLEPIKKKWKNNKRIMAFITALEEALA